MSRSLDIKIISISGGSGSGKTTAAHMLQSLLGKQRCKILSQDNYYIDQSDKLKEDGSINFDHPDALDFLLMEEHLKNIKQNRSIKIPHYDFVTHKRKTETELFEPTEIVIVDGTLVLSQKNLRPFFNESLFLDIPEEIRYERRLKRDVKERGRKPEGVHKQFYSTVKPMHDMFVQPSKQFATFLAYDDASLNKCIAAISQPHLRLKPEA